MVSKSYRASFFVVEQKPFVSELGHKKSYQTSLRHFSGKRCVNQPVTFRFLRAIRINGVHAAQINLNCRKYMDSYRMKERSARTQRKLCAYIRVSTRQ